LNNYVQKNGGWNNYEKHQVIYHYDGQIYVRRLSSLHYTVCGTSAARNLLLLFVQKVSHFQSNVTVSERYKKNNFLPEINLWRWALCLFR